jgi:hypothetical protein
MCSASCGRPCARSRRVRSSRVSRRQQYDGTRDHRGYPETAKRTIADYALTEITRIIDNLSQPV